MYELAIFRLEWICQNENVEFDPLAIDELIELCDGDMRKSVTALQVKLLCFDVQGIQYNPLSLSQEKMSLRMRREISNK